VPLAEEITANFGAYDVLRRNCQHLVQSILAKIDFVSEYEISSVKEPGRTLTTKFGGDQTGYKTISQVIIQIMFGLGGSVPNAPMDDEHFIAAIGKEQGLKKEGAGNAR
jgi:hypothetical protein